MACMRIWTEWRRSPTWSWRMPMADLIRYGALYLRVRQVALLREFSWLLWHFLAFPLTGHTNILPAKQCTWEGRTLSWFMAWLTLHDTLWHVAAVLPYGRMSVLILACRKMWLWYNTVVVLQWKGRKLILWHNSCLKVGCSYYHNHSSLTTQAHLLPPGRLSSSF